MTKPQIPAARLGSRISLPSWVILAFSTIALAGAVFASWVLGTQDRPEWTQNVFRILLFGSPIFWLVLTGIMVWASIDLWGFVEHRTRLNIVIALFGFVCWASIALLSWYTFRGMLCSDCVT